MTDKERINRNIGLTFDFLRHLIENPKQVERLPDNVELEFIEKDFNVSPNLEGSPKKLIKVQHTFEVID